jgi:hypothetical protein
MPKRLKEELQAARGRNSLNTEIVERLERSVDPDPAMQIADMLRPVLATLSKSDQEQFVGLIAAAIDIMGKRRGKS